jgi:hypothetical protein
MKNFLFLLCCFFVFHSNSFGQLVFDNINYTPTKILRYSDDEYFVIGAAKHPTKDNDIFFLKFDLSKKTYNFKFLGDNLPDIAYGISKTSDDNILITGESWTSFGVAGRENAYLLEINENLKKIWSKGYYAYGRDAGLACKELSDGNILYVGYTRNHDPKPKAIGDALIVKTNSKGDTLWQKILNFRANDYAFDFYQLQDGNIIVLAEAGGFFNMNQADYRFSHDADIVFIKINENGKIINEKFWGGSGHDFVKKIIKSPDEQTFYIVGSTQSYGSGNFDILVMKIDEDMNVLWYKTFGGKDIDYGNSICLSENKDKLYVAASSNSDDRNPYSEVLCLDLDGNLLWKKQFNLENMAFSSDIANCKDNGCLLLGYAGKMFFNYDLFLLELSENGEQKYLHFFPTKLNLYPNPVERGSNLTIEILNKNFSNEYRCVISDCNGKIVYAKTYKIGKINFDTSFLTKGLYVCSIFSENKFLGFAKFIVQ